MTPSVVRRAPRRFVPLAAAALAASLALGGCSLSLTGDDEGSADQSASAGTGEAGSSDARDDASETAGTDSDTSGEGSAASAEAAGIKEGEEPIATATVTGTRGSYIDKDLRIDIYPFEQRGKVNMLRVGLTLPASGGVEPVTLYDVVGPMAPELYDFENLKIYQPATAAGFVMSSAPAVQAVPGETMYFWAAFAPFENDPATVDVQLSPELPAVQNVPLR